MIMAIGCDNVIVILIATMITSRQNEKMTIVDSSGTAGLTWTTGRWRRIIESCAR